MARRRRDWSEIVLLREWRWDLVECSYLLAFSSFLRLSFSFASSSDTVTSIYFRDLLSLFRDCSDSSKISIFSLISLLSIEISSFLSSTPLILSSNTSHFYFSISISVSFSINVSRRSWFYSPNIRAFSDSIASALDFYFTCCSRVDISS